MKPTLHSRREIENVCNEKQCELVSEGDEFTRSEVLTFLCGWCSEEFTKNLINLKKSKWGTCRPCARKRKGLESRVVSKEVIENKCKEKGCELVSVVGETSSAVLTLLCRNCGEKITRTYANFNRRTEMGTCPQCAKKLQLVAYVKNCVAKYGQKFPPNRGMEITVKQIENVCGAAPNKCRYISHTGELKWNSKITLKCICGNIFARKYANLKTMTGCCTPCNATVLREQSAFFKRKDYQFPSGKIARVQGYEGFCLDDILEEGIDEKDIVVYPDCVPKITYAFESKQRIYIPDVFILSLNKIIEVKSEWTYNLHKDKNDAKFAATKQLYEFELRIYNCKGEFS